MVVYQTDETRCDYSSVWINNTENMSYEKKTTCSLAPCIPLYCIAQPFPIPDLSRNMHIVLGSFG